MFNKPINKRIFISEEARNLVNEMNETQLAEEEDWESDDYWEPNQPTSSQPNHLVLWQSFVSKRMAEGHFCPADIHVPIIHNKRQPVVEVLGQFDDASSDEENSKNNKTKQTNTKQN